MVFPYQCEQLDPAPAFPEGQEIWRPLLYVKLTSGAAFKECWALVDTGADYCIFPADFAQDLGIDISLLAPASVYGAGLDDDVRFAKVLFVHEDLGVWEALVGFSPQWNGRNAGALGTLGFFDRFNASFDWEKRKFEVKP